MYPKIWPQRLKSGFESGVSAGVSSEGVVWVALSHQPKMPAKTTSTMVPRLKSTVCAVVCGAGRGEERTSPFASPCKGVAGERCVPSMERNRSRKEDCE